MLHFSASVKEEILSNMNSRPKCDACILGILLFCKKLKPDHIQLITENAETAAFFSKNLSRIAQSEILVNELNMRNRRLCEVEVTDTGAIARIYEYFNFDITRSHQRLDENTMPKKKLIPQVFSGAYLACGSVNDPNKESHLEFVIPTLDLCNDLGLLLIDNYGIIAKQMSRGKNEIVYLKDSENIQDVLTLIGAPMAALKHITVKVDKEGSNQVNRTINCATANFRKSNAAAQRQIDAINKLCEKGVMETLSQELQVVAAARVDNPDMALSELYKIIEPPVSKSGLNHRLNKLIAIADEI